jgi:hypothetical protein
VIIFHHKDRQDHEGKQGKNFVSFVVLAVSLKVCPSTASQRFLLVYFFGRSQAGEVGTVNGGGVLFGSGFAGEKEQVIQWGG